jgi:putative transposase
MDGAPLAGRKHWILDNDGTYGKLTRAVLGRKLAPTSRFAPDMNSFAERWVKYIKDECLNHVVFLHQDMLEHYVNNYVAHYHAERTHQGIGNVPIEPWKVGTGEIVCDHHLNGLLTSFCRAA